MENYTISAQSKNQLGIASYLGDYASNEDLQAFFEAYRPEAKGSNFSVVLVNGGTYNESETGDEATLDVQVGMMKLVTHANVDYMTYSTQLH